MRLTVKELARRADAEVGLAQEEFRRLVTRARYYGEFDGDFRKLWRSLNKIAQHWRHAKYGRRNR